jgi:hypothetical protein
MKGYIYILQKKDRTNTNVFKVGRTNDLQRRLNQYNKKNEMPKPMQECDGDITPLLLVGSDEYLKVVDKMTDEAKMVLQTNIESNKMQHIKFINDNVEYEYVFTKKVNDCKWVEKQLLDEMRFSWDSDANWEFQSEWFACWDGWFEETKEMIERFVEIDKERSRWMNDATLNLALCGAYHWKERLDRKKKLKKQKQIHI